MTNFLKRYDKMMSEVIRSGDLNRLLVLRRLEEYLNGSSHTSYEGFRELLSLLSKSNKEIGRIMGLKEDTVKKRVLSESGKLQVLLGDDFLDLVELGSEESLALASNRLYTLEEGKSTKDFFSNGVLAEIRLRSRGVSESPFVGEFDATLFEPEVAFLFAYNNARFNAMLQRCDPARLAYLVKVVDGKEGNHELRKALIQGLESPEG